MDDDIVDAAGERLGSKFFAIHLYMLTAAVRALIATHHEPERVRQVFDQLFGLMLTHPSALADRDAGVVMRDFAETLFQSGKGVD